MRKLLLCCLVFYAMLPVIAQNADIEAKYQQALNEAHTKSDPSTHKGHALADYYKELIAAGVSESQVIDRTRVKFRALTDYDLYAGFQCLMKVPNSGMQALRNDLSKQEKDWVVSLANRVIDKTTAYPAGVPKPGTGIKGTAGVPKPVTQGNAAATADDGRKELDAGNEAYNNKDYALALKLFQQSADKGNAAGIANLGLLHALGYGVPQNYKLAKSYFQQAIDKGNAFAMYRMGLLYVDDSLIRNDNEAYKWFLQSAEKNNAWGQVWTGHFLESGRGTALNFDKALEWYKKAAATGNKEAETRAQRLEGDMKSGKAFYDAGVKLNTAKKYQEALPWLIRAAENGSILGAHRLGLMHTKGEGIDKDTTAAIKWYQLAAEKGHNESQYNLGVIYYFSNRHAESLPWFFKAAEQGNTDAMNNIGTMYHYGRGGLKEDLQEAIKWYKQAADKGSGMSMYNMGVVYEYGGAGMGKNLQEAKNWYEKSLAAKYTKAQERLDVINKAIADQAKPLTPVAKPATVNYHPDPQAFELYKKGKTAYDAKNYTVAMEWFLKAADGGDIESLYMIGTMYDYGYGVTSSLDEAIYWYEKAEAKGHVKASNMLDDIWFYGW